MDSEFTSLKTKNDNKQLKANETIENSVIADSASNSAISNRLFVFKPKYDGAPCSHN